MQQAIGEVANSTERIVYRVADQSILVEALDQEATHAIEALFSGWYLTRDTTSSGQLSTAIRVSTKIKPPKIPRGWPQFEIAGGGVCFTDGKTSHLDIDGSIVTIHGAVNASVEVWTNGRLELASETLTRVVTYALSAALRRRGLFELHSGAVIDPETGAGVLIIGPSGSGKSTLTVQLASAGWPFLTDDVLVLGAQAGEVNAWPLRRCFAITAKTFGASRLLSSQTRLEHIGAGNPDGESVKRQFMPHEVFESEFRASCVPRSLLFTELSGAGSSEMTALSSVETMARLIRMNPWSCYDQVTAVDHLAMLSELVKQSQGYSLHAGRDLLNFEVAVGLITPQIRK